MRCLLCPTDYARTLVRDLDITLVEASCVHGKRWYEGPTPSLRGWHPRQDGAKTCGRCSRVISQGRVCDACRSTLRRALSTKQVDTSAAAL